MVGSAPDNFVLGEAAVTKAHFPFGLFPGRSRDNPHHAISLCVKLPCTKMARHEKALDGGGPPPGVKGYFQLPLGRIIPFMHSAAHHAISLCVRPPCTKMARQEKALDGGGPRRAQRTTFSFR
jgi:hypothetical protein